MNAVAIMTAVRTSQQWVTLINGAWQKTVDGIIETGRLLIQCKEEIGHGSFEAMVQSNLNFDPDTAQRLMAIARNPILSNAANSRLLPPSWYTLYGLTKIDEKLGEGTLVAMIKDGTVNPKTKGKEITALLKTNKQRVQSEVLTRTIEALRANPGLTQRECKELTGAHPTTWARAMSTLGIIPKARGGSLKGRVSNNKKLEIFSRTVTTVSQTCELVEQISMPDFTGNMGKAKAALIELENGIKLIKSLIVLIKREIENA